MKRLFQLFSLGFFCFFISIEAKISTFTILSFNDVYTIVEDRSTRGGFAEMMTILEEERAKSTHHITTVNGDFLFPCILSIFDKGAHRIELFNDMKVDLVSVGNHEFDAGPHEVLKRVEESNFPWLAANAIGLDGKPFTGDNQTLIVDVDGTKVGIFGLITVETPNLSSTENEVCFSPLVYTSKIMIDELKAQGAEVIVALTHLLIAEDLQLAKEVPEIDVILGGHDHDPITWYDDQTFVHKSGQNGYYLLRLDLILDKNDVTGEVSVFPDWKMILNKGKERHEEIAKKVDVYEKTLDGITSTPIGVMGMKCNSFNTNVRSKESQLGNLITDALRFSCGADVAIIGGGIIRGNRSYEVGEEINLKDLLTELPFGNINVMVEVEGKAILAALENGVYMVEGKAGRFPQVSGMQFTYDISKEPGNRISNVKVQGEDLDLNKLYKVATVNYILKGGDGYGMFKEGNILLSPLKTISLVDTVREYIKGMPSIYAPLENRIIRKEDTPSLDEIDLKELL
jgi:5'-nucleotidase / UDP-sugar diphosphatase